jgi:hypothetical protein
MNQELGILFLHHDASAVTRNNLASVRRHNPRATVVTISAGAPLPGGYRLADTAKIHRRHLADPQRSSDWLVCSWFVQRRETCRKWWIIEWDTYCTTSVRSYYAPVWDFAFVASSVRLPYREIEWSWFPQISSMPKKFRPYAVGAIPFIYLLAEPALRAICVTLLATPFAGVNSELRFCTVANYCGFPPCGYSPPCDYITWWALPKIPREKAIFHPVKHLVKPAAGPARRRRRPPALFGDFARPH